MANFLLANLWKLSVVQFNCLLDGRRLCYLCMLENVEVLLELLETQDLRETFVQQCY